MADLKKQKENEMLNNNCTCFSQYTMEKQYGKKQKGKFASVLIKIEHM